MTEEVVEEVEFDLECDGLRESASEADLFVWLSRPRVDISCTKEGRAVIAADDMGE